MCVHGVQIEKLDLHAKKTIAMVVVGLDNIHDVLLSTSTFAGSKFPKLQIQVKKGEVDTTRRLKHLDLVVVWALREFKVGMVNLPPMNNGIQPLYLDNIKNLQH